MKRNWYRRWGKRFGDLALGLLLSMLLLPLTLTTAVVVAVGMGLPVLFRQDRVGLNGNVFQLLKFRSMTDLCDTNGVLAPDQQRLTLIGKMLRKLSLDELPQLWNVIRGDMSLVGPRPLLTRYMPRYSAHQRRRHEVLPGITGWAQVNGRNALMWEQKFDLDVWYVDRISPGLDLKIIWFTIISVFQPRDVSAEGHATMPEFMETEDSLTSHD